MHPVAMIAAFLTVMGSAFLLAYGESWIQTKILAIIAANPILVFDLVLIVTGLFVVFVLYVGKRFREQKKDVMRHDGDIVRLSEILATVADGLFRWKYDEHGKEGEPFCSRRLANLLGLPHGTESNFRDIVECFDEEDGRLLLRRVDLLRESGIGFSIHVGVSVKNQYFQIRGERIFTQDGGIIADLVWFHDVSEAQNTIATLESALELLNVENTRLRHLQDSLTLPVWMRDDNLDLIYCNQAYADIVGVPAASVAVDSSIELVSGAHAREARTLAIRARAISEARSGQFHMVIRGERRLMEITELPLQDVGDGERATIGFAIDRTRQEELENTLKNHVVAHANVLENLTTAIAIFSKDTRLVFFNAAFSKLWNLSVDWLSSQPTYGNFLDMLREMRSLPEVVDYRAFKNEELKRFTSLIEPMESLLHLPNGKALRMMVSPHPFGGLLVTYEDVTDTLALTSSYNTLIAVQHEIINSLHEGVAVFGVDGRLTIFNSAYAELWNFDEHVLASQPYLRELEEWAVTLLDDEANHKQKKIWRRNFSAATFGSEERKITNGQIVAVDGKVLNYICVPLSDGAVLTLWIDVSDSVQMEQVLWERNELLSRDIYLKTNFMNAVSREVQTPLERIIALSENLALDPSLSADSAVRENGREIMDAGKMLLMLINTMLDTALSDRKRGLAQAGSKAFSDVFEVGTALVREASNEKDILVTIDCPDDIGRLVITDRRFKLSLFILMGEVVSLTRPGGTFTLSARWSDREHSELTLTFANSAGELELMNGYAWNEKRSLRQILVLLRDMIAPHKGEISVYHAPEEIGSDFRRIRIVCHLRTEFPIFSLTTPDQEKE